MNFSMTSAVLGQVRPELIQLFPSVFQDVPTGLERPKVLTFFKVGGFDRKKNTKTEVFVSAKLQSGVFPCSFAAI